MKVPVTVVTGFLGSGKTTLLSRALEGSYGRNAAVVVNELGEVGLDHHLLRRTGERTTLLGGGCVCCARREDLVESLVELLPEKPERFILETSGMADPAPILYTIFTDPVLRHRFEVDLVLTTVDAVNGELHLDNHPEATRQATAADVVAVTKTDLADRGRVNLLISRLRSLNPTAKVVKVSPDSGEVETLFQVAGSRTVNPASPAEERHPDAVRSLCLTFDGAVDWAAFGTWLSMLLHARGESVLRVKGLLDVGEEGPVVLDGVQHVIHPPRHLEEWPDEDHSSRLVFISKGVRPEELLESLEAFALMLGAAARPVTSPEKEEAEGSLKSSASKGSSRR